MSKIIDAMKAAIGAVKPSPFVHVEKELAQVLGVAQDAVKEQRLALQLVRGSEWELVRNAVTYTEPAAKKILDALTAKPADAGAAPPAGDLARNGVAAEAQPPAWPPPPSSDVVDLVCVKLPRNQRIIMARKPDAARGDVVRVRVKDSSKFQPGMELKARHLSEDLYQLEGHSPRYTGKF